MKADQTRDERILVCVNYGHTGRRLIRRGGQLSNKLGAALIILIFDSLADDEFAYHKEIDIAIFKELAKAYNAKVIIKKEKAIDITSTIVTTAKSEQISQIIIGQMAESIWATVLGRSVIDVLLKQVPSADLHVIPVDRSSAQEEWEYDLGVRAYLAENEDGSYDLLYENNHRVTYEGIFLHAMYTEFENGIFAFLSEENKTMEVRVVNGKVLSFVDIDEVESTDG